MSAMIQPHPRFAMLLHLNGWPGVGKLTIARLLRDRFGARLLDNHTVFNAAFALAEFRSPEFYAAARSIRDAAYDAARNVPASVPIIMTNALSNSDWGRENWDAIKSLANGRKAKLFQVTLECEEREQARRMTTAERAYLGKLTDPGAWSLRGRDLLEQGADAILRLDNTDLSAADSADRIFDWICEVKVSP